MKRITTFLCASLLALGAYTQPPANDACADASVLALVDIGNCATGAIQGTTAEATAEGATPTCDGVGAVQDVWYTFNTAGFEGQFTVDITAGTIEHWGIQLFLGGCNGVLVGCFGGAPASTILPGLVANGLYTIRLFTNTDLGTAGDFSICISASTIDTDCGATVYDAGGPNGNYSGGLFPYQEVYTYCPDLATQAINLVFTQFHTRGEDIVRIYNGPDINSPLLGTFSGNLNANLPGSFQSTHPTGCITLRFNYNSLLSTQAGWAANLTCCLLPIVTVTPTSNSPVCQGGTLVLNPGPTVGSNFVWSGPNGFTSTEQFPEVPDFDIANVGSYTVTANAGVAGCSSSTTATLATVTLPPSSLTASASETLLCGPGSVDLSANAVTLVQALQEGFETFPAAGWGTSGSGVTAATNTEYYAEGTRSVRLSYAVDASGQYGMTSDINLALTPNATLSFQHICALEQGWDYGFVDYSTNGGGSWSPLPANTYQGVNNSNFTGGNVRFSRNSAAAWQSQFTGSGSTPGVGPATALWRLETFNLAQFATSTNFRIRFRITGDASINYYGWLIDDVRVNGETIPTYAWSSDPAGFTSTLQNPTDVAIANTTTFTVTASTAEGCGLTEEVVVQLLGSVPSINGPAQITRCVGVPFDLTSTLTGGEAPFTYVWSSAGSVIGAGPNLVGLILSNSTTVVLTVTDASGCQNTATVQVTVAPPPTVTLGAFTSACVNWEPFPLTGGLPAGGTYVVNGVPTTNFDPALGVGVYTVVYQFTDANGCSASAQRTLLVDACTGIDELDAIGLSIYPNPATDLLYVTANAGRYDIELLDAAGRLVHSSGLNVSNDRERTIALDAFKNGIYAVVVTTDKGLRFTKRLVIAR